MTPRLLCRDAAATYCGVTAKAFDEHVKPHVPPVEIGTRRLWDVRALDRWLDQKAGLIPTVRPIEDWVAGLGQ